MFAWEQASLLDGFIIQGQRQKVNGLGPSFTICLQSGGFSAFCSQFVQKKSTAHWLGPLGAVGEAEAENLLSSTEIPGKFSRSPSKEQSFSRFIARRDNLCYGTQEEDPSGFVKGVR